MFSRRGRARKPFAAAPQRIDRGTDCPVCGTRSVAIGTKVGQFSRLPFEVRRCPECNFGYVRDPLVNPELYDEAYYRGEGADPIVDYIYELSNPSRTIREFEWKGIVQIVQAALGGGASAPRWLDYGCGTGGLVRHARNAGFDAWGFEEGHGAEFARQAGVPLLDRASLEQAPRFDVVTAVEVIEHVIDIKGFLASIRRLLSPGGLFFYTTGNPWKQRGKALLSWSYLIPEIHVSLCEPKTMERALHDAGFRCEYLTPSEGLTSIVRFKALKTLGIQSQWPLGLPWGLRALTPVLLAATGVMAHPLGIAR